MACTPSMSTRRRASSVPCVASTCVSPVTNVTSLLFTPPASLMCSMASSTPVWITGPNSANGPEKSARKPIFRASPSSSSPHAAVSAATATIATTSTVTWRPRDFFKKRIDCLPELDENGRRVRRCRTECYACRWAPVKVGEAPSAAARRGARLHGEMLEATAGIEPTMEVLQTSALPLGYVAELNLRGSFEAGAATVSVLTGVPTSLQEPPLRNASILSAASV